MHYGWRFRSALTPSSTRGRSLQRLESLEERCLLSANFSEFALPAGNQHPVAIVAGPDGALWFTQTNDQVGRITTGGVITEFALPGGSDPGGIAVGPDNALWIAETGRNKIGRITTAGQFTEYSVPGGGTPFDIVAGPDGALWFTENNKNSIGRITTGGVVTNYMIPTGGANPEGITAGPDGALWFVENGSSKIGRITTTGSFTEYTIPTSGSHPEGITVGPDGALWFTENADPANSIGRLTTAGVFTEYALPTAHSKPVDITVGSDGTLWFTLSDPHTNAIGQITVAGAITEYSIPSANASAGGLTTGPDGAIWFAENATNKIGRLQSDAVITITGVAIQPTEGAAISGVVANMADADTNAPASGFTALIHWGDGTTSSGVVSGSTGQFQISGTHTYSEEGSYTVTVTVQDIGYSGGDSGGASATAATSILVADAALSPAGGAQTLPATEGTSTGTQVLAIFTDPGSDGTTAAYTATIHWGDGATSTGTVVYVSGNTFEILGSHVYAEAGTYAVAALIQDAGGSSATASQTTFQVADAALAGMAVSTNATEGAAFSGTVASFSDANPFSTSADFSAMIDWGDGTSSAGTVSTSVPGRYIVRGGHTYREDGVYAVRVSIADADGSTTSVLSTMTVADAPLTGTGQTINASLGILLFRTVATFTDADPNGQASQYLTQIDWGDGSSSGGSVTANPTGSFAVGGSHLYLLSGSYDVTVTVQDIDGASVMLHGVVNVGQLAVAALDINTTEGTTWTGTVAAFNNPVDPTAASGQYSATIDWGDGTILAGTITPDGNGGFYVSGSHAFEETGSYTATVQIQCTSGLTGMATDAVQVDDAPLSATGQAIAGTEGALFNGLVATFYDANPNAALSDYTVTIDWGDGARSLGTVARGSSGGFDVSGDHVYASQGNYNVAITITDVDGSSASTTDSAQIAATLLSATGTSFTTTEGQPFQGTVLSFSDSNLFRGPGDFTATIDWGDGTSSAGTIFSTGAGTFEVVGNHTYVEEGNATVGVTVNELGGQQVTAFSLAHMNDAPLTVTNTSFSATEGQSFQGTVASLGDADPYGAIGDYSPLIQWGDGTSSVSSVVSDGRGGFLVEGSHTYGQAGQYVVTVSVLDSGGSSAQASSTTFIADAPLLSSGLNFTAQAGIAGQATVASFVDLDPAAVATNYRAVIAWGDGTSSAGGVSANGQGGFVVLGSKTYADAGSYTITVTILDNGGAATVATSTVTVTGRPSSQGDQRPPLQTTGTSQPQPSPQPVQEPVVQDSESASSSPTPLLTLVAEMLISPVGSVNSTPEHTFSLTSVTGSRAPKVTPLAHSGEGSSGDSGSDNQGAEHAAAPSTSAVRPAPVVAIPAVTPSTPAPVHVATTSPTPPGGLSSPSVVPVRASPHVVTPQLAQALDQLKHDVEKAQERPHWAVDTVFATGVATASYVALTSRAAGWLMTALLSRPLWREFDPIEILFAWEAQRKDRPSDADDDETLQSLVSRNT